MITKNVNTPRDRIWQPCPARFFVAGLGFLLVCALTKPAGAASSSPHADFKKSAVPFLEKHCVECHGGKTTKADLNLKKLDRADEAILKNRKVWMNVLTQVGAGEMPPKKQARPTLAEMEGFTQAVEAAFGRAELTMKPDPGHVTVRRLNRNEYRNTVRDLIGVDFDPTADFPSDDIGHGFDNIGDVLSLSPVLMERYMAAAESIAETSLVVERPKPPVRTLASKYLQPGGTFTARFRPLDKAGTLSTEFNLTTDGDFKFTARVYGLAAEGSEPVKMALVVNGKELKELEVGGSEKQPQNHTVPITLPVGNHRFAAKLLNPSATGELPRTLFVEWLQVEGPADTRPASHRRLVATGEGKPKAEQTREIVTRFVTRAFRRPATPVEIERYLKVAEAVETSGGKWEAGLQMMIKSVLCSPKFLFRVELDDRPLTKASHPLDEFQLASRLSYFLWSTMPDDELFALATKGQLTANLDAQVKRMLKHEQAAALVDNFALQWLQLKRLQAFAPDAKLFPNFNEPLRRAMLRETELFFGEILREDRSVLDLIDGNFTYLNEALARHYGIADTAGNWLYQKQTQTGGTAIPRDQFVRVALPMKERGGLLSQASVLTVTSNPTRTSPVKRGRWVLEQLLGTPPPPPPPNVPELDGQKKLTGTLRQRMEQHRANPNCASCHTQMDALGFALENYNAVGAWRAKDGEDAIDASGTLPDGKSFNGPGELKAVLKEKQELFVRNLTEKMLIYALGRGLEYYDGRAVRQISAQLAKQDYKFSALVVGIVKSEPFRLRRGKELNDQQAATK